MSEIYKDEQSDEWFFPKDSYILSETDSKGLILYANEIFCQMAGYSIDELIGQPHNIVRHPDMPRIAFKGLWDDIQSKGFWNGIVKNLRKDGGYYWVDATALRKVHSNGDVTYLSIRRVPSRRVVESCAVLYGELKHAE
jgi:PAS domain S-box-containing protein